MAWMGAVLGGLGKVAAGAATGAAKGVAKGALGAAKGLKKAGNSKAGKGLIQHEKDNFNIGEKKGEGGKKQQGDKQQEPSRQTNFAANWANAPKMKKGGPIKKTGIYRLHKGEYVVPAKARSGKKPSKRVASKRSVIKA